MVSHFMAFGSPILVSIVYSNGGMYTSHPSVVETLARLLLIRLPGFRDWLLQSMQLHFPVGKDKRRENKARVGGSASWKGWPGMEVDPPAILETRVNLGGDLIRCCSFDLVFLRKFSDVFLLIIFDVLAWSL